MIALLRQWRAVVLVLSLFAMVGGWWAIRSHHIGIGEQQCTDRVARAIEQQQRIADENAAVYEEGRAERQVEYRDRVREVVKYVESDSRCDWSPDAFRVLNRAITGAEPAGEPGTAVPGPTDYRITNAAGDGSLDRNGGRHVPGLPSEAQGDRQGSD